MLPTEYLYFYYYREEAVAHILRSGSSRGRQVQRLNDGLWPVLRARLDAGEPASAVDEWARAMAERGATYFARERGDDVSARAEGDASAGEGYEGVATAVLAAAVGPGGVPLVLNVPNRGAIPGMRDDDVVEVTCVVDRHGPHPLAQGRVPDAALDLISGVKRYERLTVAAAADGSEDAAVAALLAHPLVASYPTARAILDGYVEALGGLLPRLR
jgi:6-phospho-beta-glucosidase